MGRTGRHDRLRPGISPMDGGFDCVHGNGTCDDSLHVEASRHVEYPLDKKSSTSTGTNNAPESTKFVIDRMIAQCRLPPRSFCQDVGSVRRHDAFGIPLVQTGVRLLKPRCHSESENRYLRLQVQVRSETACQSSRQKCSCERKCPDREDAGMTKPAKLMNFV